MKGKRDWSKNLTKSMQKMKNGAIKGAKLGAATIKEGSQARSPVDTGFLRAGHYTAVFAGKHSITIEIGAVAEYALAVHENLTANFTVGEAQFLKKSFDENKKKVLALIHKLSKA